MRSVQLEAAKIPPLDVPGALYVEATTNINGSSTDIIGVDDCGNDDKPGIVITLEEAADPINQHGNPAITCASDGRA